MEIFNKNTKKVLLCRNGEFEGLYRYDKLNKRLVLWRTLNKKTYGKERYISMEGKEFCCNEALTIPKEYNLNNKEHLKILSYCLGGEKNTVSRRIKRIIKITEDSAEARNIIKEYRDYLGTLPYSEERLKTRLLQETPDA